MSERLVKCISGLYLGDQVQMHNGVASCINQKHAVKLLTVQFDRVVGNREADPKHHGGLDRVLHHFPREHYGQYRRWDLMPTFGDAPSMGENISTVGLNEAQVNIGDIVQIGDVTLQVTQPRSPCFKLNLQFGQPKFALAMQESRMCGWFYRVLSEGDIRSSDSIVLLERKTDISVAKAMQIYFLAEFDAAQYQLLLECDGLAQSWVNSLQRRLDQQSIEDWAMRLYGKAS
ncbi:MULTISPECIES: MOSC domain-containing protein [Shewanella]|jgi:MOSC domain-containing protein YiiM|uniref:MOSC domain-containing protein n=1 Tax=Shewanella psychromarinicola TaxID=2487742 RepID=A0A3N4E331_9GAMM|nr:MULTISPECIES: MOSC domain-containing protein [Shewanella]AZG34424.1 MOSC domain-containing protein [Shewanella psychromarinicola]MCL1082023.1 MOSC domain-containing protein [Shewanella psychromarinicola]PKG79424.1 MOSC domain-containing protein [Shewanella sp. Actino-trap-3]RPA32523.1 MOSC domain-containing protein [Shewanella psychromarinicola]|tara:strand:- start:45191 stop:45883 length:693 start_codon:yes stop_codon:yes gene_type:complete